MGMLVEGRAFLKREPEDKLSISPLARSTRAVQQPRALFTWTASSSQHLRQLTASAFA
jgi:hypothetical protein